MSANPFIAPILEILQRSPQGLSEYELMRALGNLLDDVEAEDGSQQLILFRKHFSVMNALYQLEDELAGQGLLLQISPLMIRLQVASQAEAATLSTDVITVKLKAYYLDWRNLGQTSEDELKNMLDRFWQRFFVNDKRGEALLTLGLAADAQWHQIKVRYRQLAAEHHPDKGGDVASFVEIRTAYEVLQASNRAFESAAK